MADQFDDVRITLPSDPLDIIQRLSRVNDEATLVRNFYPRIAEHAGEEKIAGGFVLMLNLAIYDFAQHYPPVIGAGMRMYIPRWIDALIDDPAGAEATKQWWQTVLDAQEAERKANTPARVEPTGPIEDYDLYVAARRVADIFFQHINSDPGSDAPLWMQDRRRDEVNPFNNQSDAGLFLEFYYSLPNKLWTPWGEWHFGGSGSGHFDLYTPTILKRFGATEHAALRIETSGEYGPVYALHKVDDIALSEPKMRERQNYLDYEVAKEAWRNMTSRYEAEHTS